MKKERSHALPPLRRRLVHGRHPARRNDLLRRGLVAALRQSGRYSVFTNASVPVPDTARAAVRRAAGGYLAASLPLEGHRFDTVVLDLLVVDERNGWAGAYAFCRHGAPSNLRRSRIEDDLRAAELVLRAHLARMVPVHIKTVTVGVIDGSADPEQADDLTIAACEIASHFEIDFENPEAETLQTSVCAPGE
jgi:hypothetical protein